MRGDEDLIARPGPRRELFRQPVSLLPGDFFFRGKRLDIVVKPDRAILAVCGPGGYELLGRQTGRTVQPACQRMTGLRNSLFRLRYILGHTAECPASLSFVLNECDCSHQRFSCSVSFCNLR